MKFKKLFIILPMAFVGVLGVVAIPTILASCSTSRPVNNQTQTKPPSSETPPPSGGDQSKPDVQPPTPQPPKPDVQPPTSQPPVQQIGEEFDYATGSWYKVYPKDSNETKSIFYYLVKVFEYKDNNQFGSLLNTKYYGVTTDLESYDFNKKIEEKSDIKTFIKKVVTLTKEESKKFVENVTDFKSKLVDISSFGEQLQTSKYGFFSTRLIAKQ